MEIKGKNVLVTGGANGIGRALVGRLVSEGASVGVLDIDKEALDKLQKDFKEVCCIPCDVSDSNHAKIAVDDFCGRFKTIDMLVNNAGLIYNSPLVILAPGSVKTHDVAMWDKVIATNLNAVFYMSVLAAEKMVLSRTKGLIINIGSVLAAGNAGQSAYSATKAAVSAMTLAWAKELSPLGIRVVCIAPGFTRTERTMIAMQENVLSDWVKRVPLRRLGEVEEIVESVIFVARNDFVNGKTLAIDGGLTL